MINHFIGLTCNLNSYFKIILLSKFY